MKTNYKKGRNKEMIFEDMLDMYGKAVEPEFSDLETTEEIALRMEEKTLDLMEQDKEFMKKFPTPIYAMQRLSYLTTSEKEEDWIDLNLMYSNNTLLTHLKEVQERAGEFIKIEKPRMMKAWGIQDEKDPQYQTMMSALREIVNKEYIEV